MVFHLDRYPTRTQKREKIAQFKEEIVSISEQFVGEDENETVRLAFILAYTDYALTLYEKKR